MIHDCIVIRIHDQLQSVCVKIDTEVTLERDLCGNMRHAMIITYTLPF